MVTKPRVLFIDLETLPNIVTSWGLWVNGMLSPDNIITERSIICGGWKWQGDKELHIVAINPKDPHNDLEVVRVLHEVVGSADAVVAHNGDKFDMRWLKARIAFHRLSPLPPVIQIDTKKIAKAAFYFNSNKLDYLAKFLGVGQKIKTEFGLWKACMAGDQKALDKMTKYCKQDLRLLEAVYDILTPHIPSKLNKVLFADREVCQHCGSKAINYRGFYYTRMNKYRRYQCCSCGCWARSLKPFKEIS